jgi:hypothetical protein
MFKNKCTKKSKKEKGSYGLWLIILQVLSRYPEEEKRLRPNYVYSSP